MGDLNQTWQGQQIDAISIHLSDSDLRIQGIDGDLIRLEGKVDERRRPGLKIDSSSRRLKLSIPHNYGSQLTLKLPFDKPQVVEIFAGKANLQVRDIQARLRVMVGKGDIEIEGLRGVLAVASGQSNVRLKNFVQAQMPEPPPQSPPTSAESHGNTGWDWLHRSDSEWEDWGQGLGERISTWAMGLNRFFGPGLSDKNPGISICTGKGNVELAEIEAAAGLIKLFKGDLSLNEVYVANLDLNLSHGNINGKSIVPGAKWNIRNSHGDIHLSLPSNIGARLDMATRNGNIVSETPLVRVTRQGPEVSSGRRMVGMVGPNVEGNLPELHIAATHGNIEIDSHSPVSRSLLPPEIGQASLQPPTMVEPAGNVPSPLSSQAKEGSPPPIFEKTPLGVLEGLHNGTLSVSEAEKLLRSFSL